MAFIKHYNLPEPITTSPCIHIRSKTIYVTGELRSVNESNDMGGSGHCWCNLTQHILGPDEKSVDSRGCTPERSCYRDAY